MNSVFPDVGRRNGIQLDVRPTKKLRPSTVTKSQKQTKQYEEEKALKTILHREIQREKWAEDMKRQHREQENVALRV